ncbi:MASE1 domain-containing protein [Streptomyces scopuliridis]|uniref:MASE1 domain-containing protein n=1 Tax=Streptomyces scopuliridis TaxID=452529 RepID=A0ACD4ZXB6_9ACTN|nr:MASE1 domain-containing protein [Streptomyces scopuliridis]WSC03135.1 MASE1 domain-containing protein [Streptomyces scopuliridis]WSC10988.1 MASE1 domain-containing protein [Streptomyces scopuliridis]
MVRTEEVRRLSLAVPRILGVAVAYYGAAQLGLLKQLVIGGAVVTPLWPSSGIALAGLLFLGLGVWPGISLGALFTIVTLGPIHLFDIGIIAASTLAPVCACLMLRHVGFRTELDRLRDGVALVFLGALAGMLISATLGTAMLLIGGKLRGEGFWPAWSAWWAGDAMGVLVVTPMLLMLRGARWPRAADFRRWPEALALLIVAVVVTPLATMSALSLLFLVFPVLIWAALRFQLAGSAPYALFVSVLAISEATDLVGAFAHHTLIQRMIALQALNGSVALTSLLLASIVTEQRNVRLKIEQACVELADLVAHLSPAESPKRWRPGRGKKPGKKPGGG